MAGESNQSVLLIQIDASSFADFGNPSSRYRKSTVLINLFTYPVFRGCNVFFIGNVLFCWNVTKCATVDINSSFEEKCRFTGMQTTKVNKKECTSNEIVDFSRETHNYNTFFYEYYISEPILP